MTHCSGQITAQPRIISHWGFIPGLGDQGGGGGRLVLEGGGDHALGAVVTRKTMDTRLDQNKTELAILVLSVAVQVLAHADGALREFVYTGYGT